MNPSYVASTSLSENPALWCAWRRRNGRGLALGLIIGAFCFSLGGCVGDGYLGVSTYPSYEPYYGYYGYSGTPYYGYGGIYTRNIVVRGRRYSGGYGRQHFSRYRSGYNRANFSRSRSGGRDYRGGRGRGRR